MNTTPHAHQARWLPFERHLLGAALMAAGLAVGLPAQAQSIDYGSLEELFQEPVTTSATGSPQRSTDVPADMRIITAEDIRRSGATDIPEILRMVPGFDVWRSSFSAVDATVRGYNRPYSQRLLVLINGRQVYKDYCGYTGWGALPVNLSEIRQIEVVKGPNAALFGFNAVGGVVNIITYSPLYDDHNNFTARIGNHNYREASLTHTLKFGDVGGARVSLRGFRAHEFDTPTDLAEGPYRHDRPDHRHAAVDSLFQVTDRTQFGVEASKVNADQTNLLPFYGLTTAKYDTQSLRATLNAETRLGLIEATAYQNRTRVDMNNAFIGDTEIDNRITVARVQDLFKVGADHTFRLSGEFRRNELASLPFEGGKVSYDVWAAGAMWDWQINHRFSLNNALRYDHLNSSRRGPVPEGWPFDNRDYDNTLREVSWNSGLVYRATDRDTFRLLGASGVQLPSMIEGSFMLVLDPTEFDPQFPFDTAGAAGNPYVKPTRVTNFSLTWDRDLPEWNSLFHAAVYHMRNRDLKSVPGIQPDMMAAYPVVMFTNIGDSNATGFELGLRGGSEQWRWEINYAYERISDHLTDNVYGPDGQRVKPVDFAGGTPNHKINGRIGYSTGPWEFDLYGHYVSRYAMLESDDSPFRMKQVDIPGYTLLSGRIGYQFHRDMTLALSGQSFNRASHRETAAPKVERRVNLTLSIDY